MSEPRIMGFRSQVPWWANRIMDTIDSQAFDLGVAVPGSFRENYNGWWWNMGPAKLFEPRLRLVAHPTLDQGSDSDTIDVMALGQSSAEILANAEVLTHANTAGWGNPLTDPFKPWEERFRCGIKWSPPDLASPGKIRKAFQWDGGYYPDTWDWMYYPMGNGYFPDNDMVFSPIPLQLIEGPFSHHFKILPDGATPTGVALEFWSPSSTSPCYYRMPNTAGYPWFDNVNQATGYIIKTKVKIWGDSENAVCGISVKDGTSRWVLRWWRVGGTRYIGTDSVYDGFVHDINYPINTDYREVVIKVQGSSFKVLVDGVLAIENVLATWEISDKTVEFGAVDEPYPISGYGGHWGHSRFQYMKIYTGGGIDAPTT